MCFPSRISGPCPLGGLHTCRSFSSHFSIGREDPCDQKPRGCLHIEMERLLMKFPSEFPFGITEYYLQKNPLWCHFRRRPSWTKMGLRSGKPSFGSWFPPCLAVGVTLSWVALSPLFSSLLPSPLSISAFFPFLLLLLSSFPFLSSSLSLSEHSVCIEHCF